MLRKIITIQDLTLCLDKMDASGKIEIYQVFILRYILHIFFKYVGKIYCKTIYKEANLDNKLT